MIKYFCDVCGKELTAQSYPMDKYKYGVELLCWECWQDFCSEDAKLRNEFYENLSIKLKAYLDISKAIPQRRVDLK